MHAYGLNVDDLDKLITTPRRRKKGWGFATTVVDIPEYRLERFDLKRGSRCPYVPKAGFETTLYVEFGSIKLGRLACGPRSLVTLDPREICRIEAKKDSLLYLFSAPCNEISVCGKKFELTDHRLKYWGEIETLVSTSTYSAKRMVVKKGAYASLEFHCRKLESYYIQSGRLLLRLRAGRGEDRFFELMEGRATTTPQGLMHQRGGIEDTVIIEIATKDEDSDSFLVEDGAKHKMPRLESFMGAPNKKRGKQICFDIDGVLCSQTPGRYEEAIPDREAIRLVNRLYDQGHTILLFTARFMGRNQNDQKKAHEEGYAFTQKQLNSWGVKYHELFLGKPQADIFIDDRALFFKNDWRAIERIIVEGYPMP